MPPNPPQLARRMTPQPDWKARRAAAVRAGARVPSHGRGKTGALVSRLPGEAIRVP